MSGLLPDSVRLLQVRRMVDGFHWIACLYEADRLAGGPEPTSVAAWLAMLQAIVQKEHAK